MKNVIMTEITEENISAFRELLPEGIPEERYAIGALTGEMGALVPVGLMIFSIGYSGYEKNLTLPPSLFLHWLFVSENERSKGVGRAMLTCLYSIAQSAHVNEIRCRLTAPELDTCPRDFLSDNGFEFSETERICIVRPMGVLFTPKQGVDSADRACVRFLEDLSFKELESIPDIFGEAPKIFDAEGRLTCNAELSCVVMHKEKISGIFLVSSEKTVSRRKRLAFTFIRMLPGVPVDKIRRLLKLSFLRTLELYGPEIPVYLETEYPPSIKLVKYGVKDCPVENILIGIRPVMHRGSN
ncbi:MAG: GNAT family N-acetyltransferase [Lachnospiraceae bacterium]|nr:GNAT family N-acetyltransferase [Lachnospiraceae bacterium]